MREEEKQKLQPQLKFDILSLFPEYFDSPFSVSMLRRAQEKGVVELNLIDIRSFVSDQHRRVDDRVYGGGPGMLMMPGPCVDAIRSCKQERSHVIHLSPQGETLSAKKCQELSKETHLILLCGHYEGIDQRVIDSEVDEEISIGDYVLTNGCLPAIVLIDGVTRFLPGALGHEESARCDSFQDVKLEGPQYTRPSLFEGRAVPEVLLNGNHEKIDEWRKIESIKKTRKVRPELIEE